MIEEIYGYENLYVPEDYEYEDFGEEVEEIDSKIIALQYRANSEKNKNVKLNKPFRTPGGPKKFSVYTKNEKGNIVKVNFGDPKMEIKRDDPNRRKNFRARHNCSNPGPKWKARYWSCRFWSSKDVSKLTSNILENKMDHEQLVQENDLLKKQIATLEETIKAEAQAKLDSSKVELESALAENQALKVSVTEAAEKMDNKKKGYERQKEEDDEKMKEAKSAIETLQKELAEIKAEAVKANRVSALVSADVPKEKAEEIVNTFASLDDDLFEKISVLYSNSNASADSEDGLKDALEKSQASAKRETGDQKKQENPIGDTADLAKALAKKLFNQKD